MPIVFSDHAKEQIKRRDISMELVIETVQIPEKILSSFRGRKLRQRRTHAKLLEVVTTTEGSRITVITAYFLEE
jgi:hypothetical protein